MKKQIRMIGLDLDGTLLTGDKELTNHTKNILLRAIEQGVIILPATGRPLTGIPEEILQLPGIQYALTANGARIINIKTN
ncbi:MAG: HAD hydrolase family protein, partial [Lachnospiraceae bacterium]|nr:HAD hydrolase family protein [Lachnospiraceae bacterium]